MSLTHTVFPLDDPLAKDASKVGGKTAGLAAFIGILPVPKGYVVSSDGITPMGIAEGVQAQLEKLLLPEGDDFWPVAVRSSGIGEDSSDASFAGQHETVLNVTNEKELEVAVIECIDSFYSPRVISYRRQKGISTSISDIHASVLVQCMVPADWSAVAFGKNIATGADQIVINMAPGLGDKIVSGQCNPVEIILNKDDGKLVSIDAGDFTDVKIPVGNAKVIIDALRTIESSWDKGPVDMECAFIGKDFYLLQARPITV